MNDNLPSAEILNGLREFDSPTISNAIEHFKVRDPTNGYASLELSCQFKDLRPMVGFAVTCTADTTTPGDRRPMKLDKLFDFVHASPQPSVLVIKHVGVDRLRTAFVGDMFCTALQKLGTVGVVTDGGNRDARGIRRQTPEFQLFSPGWVVSHGCPVYLDFGPTVSICGLTIQMGDILHGDESGLLTVPAEISKDVVDRARFERDQERDFFDYLHSDSYSFDGLKRRMGRH